VFRAHVLIRAVVAGLFLVTGLFPFLPLAHAVEAMMFEYTDTYCFGRFLVDVPREAELRGQDNQFYAKRIDVGRGKEAFQAKIEEALNKRKNETGKRGFKLVRNEYPESVINQIIVSKADLYGDILYLMDVFALRRPGYYFHFTAGPYDGERIEKIVAVYRDLVLPALRHRPEYEIPREPGFCFENGFIAVEGERGENESASLAFRLKDYPDVWIRIRSMVYFAPEKPLIERHRNANPPSFLHEDSVRQRSVNGMDGDEVLVSGRYEGNSFHNYEWETLGELKNPLKPSLALRIKTGEAVHGKPVSTALDTEQVRKLYETVLKSIRFRPTGEAATANVPSSR
jgi:hypothetical protein